ncbi:MAG: hypothetical protein J6Q21_00840 [Alistipes sp.]|nr:hypothetical protein [Alistipes sp.]
MNAKWKIAILAMLGLSTAACCSTKRAKKGEDPKPTETENQMDDPRIMLMYGVPFPDGEVVRPVEEESAIEAKEEGVPFEDGRVVHPISEEEAAKLIEELKASEKAE